MNLLLCLVSCVLFLVSTCHAVPHSSISHTLHTNKHLTTLSHVVNQTHLLNELLDGRRAPQEMTPGIRIDPTAEPGLTLFAPANSAFDSTSHLSHVDLLYHVLPISLSLKPVNNYTTTFWVRTMSTRHSEVQVGVGQVLEVVIVPHKDDEFSSYVIFGTPYSPHNIARVTSSIPCSNGMLHIIDMVMTLPDMTSEVMEILEDHYQHQASMEQLLKQREKYEEKHKDKKDEKDEKDIHHHDRFIRRGIDKYHDIMNEYGLMRTVDRFRGITMFIPASTIETNLKHYSSNTLSVALLHHIIPGPPIYSFATLLDGATTRTLILQGISGPVTLTIQRRSGFTPAMDTTDSITVLLNGHVVNPIASITRNGVIYIVDSCLPDSGTTIDSCVDFDTSAPLPVVTSDKEALHDMEERLREMRQQVEEREHEMQQRHDEIQHDLKQRERELIQQYQEKYGHGEQPQQREQPQQPQGDYTRYIPDYQRFIPGYQQKEQPLASSQPHVIHLDVGHDKTLSIMIGPHGIIVTQEYKSGCDQEDQSCHDKHVKEEECECELQDDKCHDECDKKYSEKEKEREYEKEKEHAHEKEKEHELEHEKEKQHEKEKEQHDKEEREHEKKEKERAYEKEKEREHEEREHEKEKEREHEKEKEKEKEREHEREKEKQREHDKKAHEHQHDKHDETCDKKECDHKKHHDKHDKHNKHDTKSTSDASVMMIAPELDPSLYDDDQQQDTQQHPDTPQQHDMSTWTMILTVGILGALVLGCATAGYCCLYFQHQPPTTTSDYATASETTGLLTKSCVPPVRNDMIVTRPCCKEEICDVITSSTEPPPLASKSKPTFTLNGYHNSPNGCTHPILGDASESESERYMQQPPLNGTSVVAMNGKHAIGNGNETGHGKPSNKGDKKRKRSSTSNAHSNGNGAIPRSEAVNIQTKTSPK